MAWYATRVSTELFLDYSYDLELDKKLSEETTVLVESYTVRVDSLLFLAKLLIASIAIVARWSSDQSRLGTI